MSLGSGFRGGLFFATLFLGALGGHLFAAGFDAIWPGLELNPNVYAIIGMSALSASVIGGPLTMSFIALESTGNLWLTTAVLVAVMISTHDHARTVRLFVRDLAPALARRNHP